MKSCCSSVALSKAGLREDGGNGENFVLTERGSRLMSLIDSSIPGFEHPRQVLDEQVDALDETTFEQVSAKAQIA